MNNGRNLTPRQREIVEIIATEGSTYEEIGAKLQISESTVRTHAREARLRSGLTHLPVKVALTKFYYETMKEG